jgi:hypothetical protein
MFKYETQYHTPRFIMFDEELVNTNLVRFFYKDFDEIKYTIKIMWNYSINHPRCCGCRDCVLFESFYFDEYVDEIDRKKVRTEAHKRRDERFDELCKLLGAV